MLPAIFGCMSAPSAAFAVRKNTLEIADTLVARAHELGLEEDMSSHMSVLLQHVYLHLKLLVDKGGPRVAASGLATPQERMQVWSYCMCRDSYYVSVGCCRQLRYMCAHLLCMCAVYFVRSYWVCVWSHWFRQLLYMCPQLRHMWPRSCARR